MEVLGGGAMTPALPPLRHLLVTIVQLALTMFGLALQRLFSNIFFPYLYKALCILVVYEKALTILLCYHFPPVFISP